MAAHIEESEPWRFTVVKSNGLRLMRPEKSWRPIITVEIDKHHRYETTLGVDGQNPNLKEQFHIHQARLESCVDIHIWHRSQSKKKAKKRNLVASASHTLGELLKRQETELRRKVEIRLQCQSSAKKVTTPASRGKPQNGATLLLIVRPPPTFKRLLGIDTQPKEDGSYYSDGFGELSSGPSTAPSTAPVTPISDHFPETSLLKPDSPSNTLRRRKRRPKPKPFTLFSDDEVHDEYETYSESEMEECKPEEESIVCDDDEENTCVDSIQIIPSPGSGWFAPSLLPQHTLKVDVPDELNVWERMLSSFTMYRELKTAARDSEFEGVHMRIRGEWTYLGGILVAMAAVSTAVFAIAPDSIFQVEGYARTAIAASSICSGLGIATDAWFLLRYNWTDVQTFLHRALDVYQSYVFFALSSRVPALCLFISSLSLMLFLALVAFDVWPMGVMVVSFLVGVVMGLQWLVWLVHALGVGIGRSLRAVWKGFVWFGIKVGLAKEREAVVAKTAPSA